MKFQIENENFELKFGFGVFYVLGKYWGLQTFDESLKKIFKGLGKYATVDVKDLPAADIELTYEATETMADLVMAAIVANKQNGKSFEDFFVPDVISAIVQNIDVMPALMTEFISSMPGVKKQETPGKKLAAQNKPH